MVESNVIALRVRAKKSKRVKRKIDKVFKILRDYIIPFYFVYELIKHFLTKVRKRQKQPEIE